MRTQLSLNPEYRKQVKLVKLAIKTRRSSAESGERRAASGERRAASGERRAALAPAANSLPEGWKLMQRTSNASTDAETNIISLS